MTLSGRRGGDRALTTRLDQSGLPDQVREVHLFDVPHGAADRYNEFGGGRMMPALNPYSESTEYVQNGIV